MEQTKKVGLGTTELHLKQSKKDIEKIEKRKSISKATKCSANEKNVSPAALSKMKDVSVRMVRAGTYLVPGKGMVKTPEKKHKTILNSMRKSPVKKALEEKQEKNELKSKDTKFSDTSDTSSPKKQVKKVRDKSKTLSPDIPDILITPCKDDVGKVKKDRNINKKEKNNKETLSPNSGTKSQESTSDTSRGKSRTPSKSPSPSRKRRNASPDKNVSIFQTPELGSKETEKTGKRGRSPNSKPKKDDHVDESEKNSPKRSPRKLPSAKGSPRSGSSSKSSSSSSSSKKSSSSEDSFTTSSSSTTHSSSNSTTPEKSSSPNISSAVKKLFTADEVDDKSDSAKVLQQPVFEGLENCSITIDDKSLGMLKSYRYKYPTAGEKKTLNTLSELIAKVNSNIETPDHERNQMLGTAETVDTGEEMSSPGRDGDLNEYNDSMDSDKTVTEFDNSGPSLSLQKIQEESPEKESSKEDNNTDEKADTTVNVQNISVEADHQVSTEENTESVDGDNTLKIDDVNDEKLSTSDSRTNISEKIKPPDSENDICKIENEEGKMDDADLSKEISIFEHFGLKLKKKDLTGEKLETENTAEITEDNNGASKQDDSTADISDDVVCISDSDVVVISDEENTMNSPGKKKKFPCVNHVVEPKPIQILTNVEKQVTDKTVAFLSEELEEYIDVNKENMGPLYRTVEEKGETCSSSKSSPVTKEYICSPDMDEVNGFMFVSFSSEDALKAHIKLEKRLEWLTEGTLKKLSQLKIMKERQIDAGKRRVTDVKSADEQKQNFRGLHMKYSKYQKVLKQEYDLLTDAGYTPEKSMLRTPEKTDDITKIKGWKNKFSSSEDLQEAARLNLMESGKLHWKTEEKLLRNLNPDDVRDIGLDLKKKRRKLVNYSSKKKHGIAKLHDRNELSDTGFEYLVDEDAITEKDVYNEDDDKPLPEKIPYCEKYLSQHKYGARKLFVKKMRLDATDEMILKKLGTCSQKNDTQVPNRVTRGRQLVFSKITHIFATAAVSAFDGKLLNKAKRLAETSRKTRSKRGIHDGQADIEDVEDSQIALNTEDYKQEDEGAIDDTKSHEEVKEKDKLTVHNRERRDRADRKKSFDNCNQPGCRYGCICHLCKLSDSGEEKESEKKPVCDKEYCKLGCICDSIDTKQLKESHGHCRKPACMFECRCPPKQPKPDIPKVRGKKKKRAKGAKKSQQADKMEEDEELEAKEEELEEIEKEDEWEPPCKKKKRSGSGNRFANLPKRESTYRLAKNLDAVSRKAMIVYESSEMYTEQKIRRRRSDPMGEFILEDQFGDVIGTSCPPVSGSKREKHQMDDIFGTLGESRRERLQSSALMGTSQELLGESKRERPKSRDMSDTVVHVSAPKLNPETGVLEISDESGPEDDPGTCARCTSYTGDYNRHQLPKMPATGGSSTSKPSVSTNGSYGGKSKTEVIDLDSDNEDKVKVNKKGDESKSAVAQLTVSQRLGLARKKDSLDASKWKTQMVCLKAKKRSDDTSPNAQSEIKLLEIISNCSWEGDRTNMLSKISHIISKDYTPNYITMWQNYVLQFLPKADKPAVIPPELQSKLPNSMYSIRVRVTQNMSDIEKAENDVKDEEGDKEEDEEGMKNMTDEERKNYCIKQQGKLIEKIKFAERLRDLIKTEELKGISPSKFSVSLDGIEKALKRYKTQLYKAYTGTSNKSLMQIKQAIQALKKGGSTSRSDTNTTSSRSAQGPNNDGIVMPSGCGVSSGTLSRLQSNQGLKIHNSCSTPSGAKSFISLGSIASNNTLSTSNITVKSQDHPLPKKPPACKNKPVPSVSSSPSINPQGNEVLLIPIQDTHSGKWDPNASPVFTAKVTMIPTNGTNTNIKNTVMNLTSVPSPGIVPPNMPVRMVTPSRCPASTKLTKPILNPALTAYAHAPFLPGHTKNQPPGVGNSQILFSSIQPISTGSPVFSQVQSMMTQRMPFNSVPVAPLKTVPPVGICRPQVPGGTPTAGNTKGKKTEAPQFVSGKAGPMNPFPPIRYASSFVNSTSGPVNFITNTNSNAKQVILVPVSSSAGPLSLPSGTSPGQTMIAVPVSPVIPPTSKPVRMVSPQTVSKPIVSEADDKIQAPNSAVQSNDSVQNSDLSSVPEQDLKSCDKIASAECANVHESHSKTDVIEIKNDDTDENCDKESPTNSVQVVSSLGGNAIGEIQPDKMDTVTKSDDKPSFSLSDKNNVIDLEFDTKGDKSYPKGAPKIDLTCNDTEAVGQNEDGGHVGVDHEAASRKRKGIDHESENAPKVIKIKGVFIDQDTKSSFESEDSDVDIVSFDDSVAGYSKLKQSNRRKSQQVATSLDDFQIKSVKVRKIKKPTLPLDMSNTKIIMERTRRHVMKDCQKLLARTTFKYNPELSGFSSAIPEHLLLSESKKLIEALKHKAARLQESIADGTQYQQSLREKLKEQIDGFVKSGVPETILKNFLKSVSKAANSTLTIKQKLPDTSIIPEDNDADLDYKRLSTADVMRNRNISLEKVLDAIGETDLPEKAEFHHGEENEAENSLLLEKLNSLDSGVYIDNAEHEIVDVSSDNEDSERLLDEESGSEDEIRSSTGDNMLHENDIEDLQTDEVHSTANFSDKQPEMGELVT